MRLLIIGAVLLSIALRATLIFQNPALTWEAYHTLLHVQHIMETGLPLITSELAWGGAHMQTNPLFYYVIAFATIFLEAETAALWAPNILISLLPIPVYLLASQLTKNTAALISATLASAFVPILYPQTLFSATPLSLAIPLFFLTYYYFIRLAVTPKYQIHYIVSLVALTLTHPIALLLIPAMLGTITLTYVQRTRFSLSLTEVTLFTSFFVVWANVVIHKTQLSWHGLRALNATLEPFMGVSQLAVLVGVIPLVVGVWASFRYLVEQKDVAAHALMGLAGAILLGTISTLLPLSIALALGGCTLTVLMAGGIHHYAKAKRTARMPLMYILGFILFIILFVATSVIPALTLGVESMSNGPTQADKEILAVLPQGEMTLWSQERGFFLQYHGIPVPYDDALSAHPRSREITSHIQQALIHPSELRFIQALNNKEVQIFVAQERPLRLGERCFSQLNTDQEVYRVVCVVQ